MGIREYKAERRRSSVSRDESSNRFGYAGINHSLNADSGRTLRVDVIHNRDAILKQAEINLEQLRRILGFNHMSGLKVFRVNTWLVTQPHFYDYQDIFTRLGVKLADAQVFVEDAKMRLTVHASVHLQPTHREEWHQIMLRDHLQYCYDLLAAIGTADSVIELHLGKYWNSSREIARERAIDFLMSLSPELRSRIAIENDEHFNVFDCMHVCEIVKTNFVYDTFHHKCWPGPIDYGDYSIQMALEFARDFALGRPLVHISSQDAIGKLGAHAKQIELADYAALKKVMKRMKLAIDLIVEAGEHEKAAMNVKAMDARRW